jgi:hypothetical protein
MKKMFLRAMSLALSAAILSACASPGELVAISLTMPRGEQATMYAHNQQVPDWLLDTNRLALNYIVLGKATAEQVAAVAEAERACRIYTKTVRPNEWVAVGLNGALYLAAGFVGGGAGSQVFSGANFIKYGLDTGAVYGAGGLANGVIQMGGKTYTFENCGREILNLFPGYGAHVMQKSPY